MKKYDEQIEINKARLRLRVERKNLCASYDARSAILTSKSKEIDAWENALENHDFTRRELVELRKIAQSHTIEIIKFSSGGKVSTMLDERAQLLAMTPKERLAACDGEPEVIGLSDTWPDRYRHGIKTGRGYGGFHIDGK